VPASGSKRFSARWSDGLGQRQNERPVAQKVGRKSPVALSDFVGFEIDRKADRLQELDVALRGSGADFELLTKFLQRQSDATALEQLQETPVTDDLVTPSHASSVRERRGGRGEAVFAPRATVSWSVVASDAGCRCFTSFLFRSCP
jgi:hypothetical protein